MTQQQWETYPVKIINLDDDCFLQFKPIDVPIRRFEERKEWGCGDSFGSNDKTTSTIEEEFVIKAETCDVEEIGVQPRANGPAMIISKEGELLLKDNFEGGATWAFEVGSQSMGCPIIVEDLSAPRQMLLEMLCQERGCFLEIADIVRGLGLTILKGVMEILNDKAWVRFTVEANRDVTRMEIFLSLVHLLGQTVKNSASSSKGTSISYMTERNNSHQAAILATGLASTLQ
ncbi:hypothetical protein GIB67_042057 [Kingdonia uniflora]|uniref:Uncharacterized protein n=1 Tax=Kingdonia uniflora TaxID=39325 RepID=A0A7J7MVT5_9MAGN|nr:hypothetical protein GIB67_042057 [Kingdonia uniflora]